MEFIPLFYSDRLDIINPEGDVGMVTLWSPRPLIRKYLTQAGIDLERRTSRIAAIGTLYGEGLPELLRNLAHNPQIRHLVLFGVDLGGSRELVLRFFEHGLERTTCLGATVFQISGTRHKIDDALGPDDFRHRLTVTDLGLPKDGASADNLRHFFSTLGPRPSTVEERRRVPLPTLAISRYPSEPRCHAILAQTPMEAWRELIFRIYRFGHRVDLGGGEERIELQSVKVTVGQPLEESEAVLAEHGFSLEKFKKYQGQILTPDLPPDQHYGYGHRLRRYFGARGEDSPVNGDALEQAIALLRANPESRHVYISLWDTTRDFLSVNEGHPCLVSLFFRKFDQHLTLTATFRTHNALRAWPENVYGLIAIQRKVALAIPMTPGAITIISHSLSIDPKGNAHERARTIHEFRRGERLHPDYFIPDPHGDFLVTVDEAQGRIVVEHRFEGQRLTRYTGSSALELERQLVADMALSDIAHALYLGRTLAHAEERLQRLGKRRIDEKNRQKVEEGGEGF
ncbi:MAG: hypothetical protein HQL76_00490 [Magnetococcales bacterium]|nr:hypothetical protein [Magnetococcales bacterium]